MPSYSIDGVIPVVDPTAYVHPSAVLIGDVIVGPGCYVGPCASLRGDFGRIVLEEGSNVQDHCCIHGFPDQDTVVAMTSGTRNMQGVMNVVWEKLLPALGAAKLPENLAAKQALADRLAKLMVKPQFGTLSPASGAVIFEKPYVVPTNDAGLEALTIVRGDGGQNTLKLKVKGKEYSVGLKQGEWQTGMLAWANMPEEPVGDWYTGPSLYQESEASAAPRSPGPACGSADSSRPRSGWTAGPTPGSRRPGGWFPACSRCPRRPPRCR